MKESIFVTLQKCTVFEGFTPVSYTHLQAFAGICQTWSLGCLADLAGLEKLDPFIQIVHRQLIKVDVYKRQVLPSLSVILR